ncbi:helix-turn-helix domain-containing protein [Microvirga tunisiensis]|uniref:Helix-turn-helix domain-containing protein n=1 Tax=Microvirga tunisiensis TaxID=2108360 RepID=A0A5N7N4T5_9HYPH|nr:helix-turn-helix domain-containing protein [Microvirga tunisiensis]MPR30466.1 helix-turn-helix domain-containing protein [Microvirga tunisiensis]
MNQAEAARLVGVCRQTLHDAVQHIDTEDPEGLHDRAGS